MIFTSDLFSKAPIMDILKSKIKSAVMPDAMVMRTIFDVIDAPPKFNSNYKNRFLPLGATGLEMLLLASSLVCNQTYEFDTQGNPSADEILQNWQDMCVASGEFLQIVCSPIAGSMSFFSYDCIRAFIVPSLCQIKINCVDFDLRFITLL